MAGVTEEQEHHHKSIRLRIQNMNYIHIWLKESHSVWVESVPLPRFYDSVKPLTER